MASLPVQIQTILRDHPILAAHHEGRVYDRPLKRRGNRATPEAFDVDGMLELSLVIVDDGDTPDLVYDDRTFGFVTVWIHGPDRDETREVIQTSLTPIIARTLTRAPLEGHDGTGVELSIADRFGLRDDPGNADAVMDYIRFNVIRVWEI